VRFSRLPARIARKSTSQRAKKGLHLRPLRGHFCATSTVRSEFLMMRWLDRFPLGLLVALALWLAVAPISPEPHLVEKLRMLSQGDLTRLIDIFDLLLHSIPLALLALRLWRRNQHR
jgi:hypothetical protein